MAAEVRSILAKMRDSRRQVCDELHAFPELRMTDQTTWSGGPADVRFMFLRYADHEEEHAIQIARVRDELGFRQTRAQRALAAAEMTRGDLLATLVGLGDDDLDIAPDGEWPLRRTLAHLVTAEHSYTVNSLHAVVRYRQGLGWEAPPPDLMPPPLDDSLDGTFSELMQRLDAARDRAHAELSGLADDELTAPTIWNRRDVSAEFRLMRFAHHEREHVAHIHKWRQQARRAPTEAEHLLGLGWRARGYLEGQLSGVPDDLLDRETPNGEGSIRDLLEHVLSTERFITGQIRSAKPAG
jgi:uncharacterized damage-inducible protein DinB